MNGTEDEQSAGTDPKARKRISGFFTGFKWFKTGSSQETINVASRSGSTSSLESVSSDKSSGTVTSFRYVSPTLYENRRVQGKQVQIGPETDTYKTRLQQRDKSRQSDKNMTLREKYNLMFHKETFLKPEQALKCDRNSKSLPLIIRTHTTEIEPEKVHRRANSESSKEKTAGAFLHVKGKRKAPQPPGRSLPSTVSFKREKRLAPTPPQPLETSTIVEQNVKSNDYLKLDNGMLRPLKENPKQQDKDFETGTTPTKCSTIVDVVSPRPWYKRNSVVTDLLSKKEDKHQTLDMLPEVSFVRNSTTDLRATGISDKSAKKQEMYQSKMAFLTNISELDREASEIFRSKNSEFAQNPELVKPNDINKNDSLISPRRRSARDLIAKFNAITGGSKQKVKYFGKQTSLDETRKRQGQILSTHGKNSPDIKELTNKVPNQLKKSDSSSSVTNDSVSRIEKKSWTCSKCHSNNEYWKIICYKCSALKTYFDDLPYSFCSFNSNETNGSNLLLERSKTQIGFPTYLVQETIPSSSLTDESGKKEEREQLKKILIDMKNSLPKRKSHVMMKQNNSKDLKTDEKTKKKRIADEEHTNEENSNPATSLKEDFSSNNTEMKHELGIDQPRAKTSFSEDRTRLKEETVEIGNDKVPEPKLAEILVGTSVSIYEKIDVRKPDFLTAGKVSSSAQTTAALKENAPGSALNKVNVSNKANTAYEPMKLQDFEHIYSDKNHSRIYANLAQKDELSLFFNMPKTVNADQYTGRQVKDALEINRLLRRLEAAIAKGDMAEAATFAKELAQLKVNCSVTRQPVKTQTDQLELRIDMYIEDKVSHRGPFPLNVNQSQTVAALKQQVSREFEIPIEVQRWILGNELVMDDGSTLRDFKIAAGCPVFLYLVAPGNKSDDFLQHPSNYINAAQQSPPKVSHITSNEPKIETDLFKSATQMNGTTRKILKTSSELPENEGKITKFIETKQTKRNDVKSTGNIKIDLTQETEHEQRILGPVEGDQNEIKIVTDIVNNYKELVNENSNTKLVEQTDKEKDEYRIKKIFTKRKEVLIPDIGKEKHDFLVDPKGSKLESRESASLIKIPKGTTTEFSQHLLNPSGLVRATSSKVEVLYSPPAQPCVGTSSQPAVDQTSPGNLKSKNNLIKPLLDTNPNSPEDNQSIQANNNVRKAPILQDVQESTSRTPNPHKEWECHWCTFLNPESCNVCEVCFACRPKKSIKKKAAPQPQTYLHLVNLDNTDLVPNAEAFECLVCFAEVGKGDGVTLRECLHQFCRDCLARTVEFAEDAEVKCPFRDTQYSCNIGLQEREIKALVSPEVYEQHLSKSISQAENQMEKTFHCKTPDCKGWCTFDDNVSEFRCPVCKKVSCLNCQAIHMGANCKQYQERIKDESMLNDESKRTKEFLEEMVQKGEAIACPTCKVILMKKWGCDWLRCSMCKTEICWVTKGPRWGPGGKGDTSSGCQCGVNGVKCHPKCNYCH